MRNKRIAIVALLAALAGFADSLYLTLEHYLHAIPPCSIHGCEIVLTSTYAVFLGIPVSLYGVVFYVAMMLLALLYLLNRQPALLHWLAIGTIVGFVVSLYLLYLQAFIIHAYCQYCLTSEALSLILFICGILVLRSRTGESL